jgi:hypothetical protein
VVKSDDGPGDSALVAIVAICGSKCRPCSGVRRIVGLLPGREVAAGGAASGWTNLQTVIIIDVARLARKIRVAIGQIKAKFTMVELGVGSQPAVEIVT